ncbi:alpha/beta fold hydrolase [Pseudonocardia sp. GCM10023141]|uniref:alpha/beta fold hydrolase n=1 Tax=Pseudonocardia sp. GCM10023141 TaxID=3252653 RepID=UPI00361CDD41
MGSAMTTVNGGQQLSYTDHGGDGPVVVLLHSFLMDVEMFAPQVAAFGADHRLIAVDERGHGGTPATAPFDYWDVARDVLGLLDHLRIDRATVIGTSQGGFVALRMALTDPDRVTGIVALGTSAAAEDPQVAAAYRQLAEAWVANGPADQLVDTVAAICLGDYDATDWKAKWRTVDGDRFDRTLTALVERDSVLERLGEVTCPVLVLHGTADAAYPVERGQELAAGVPKGQYVAIDGGAHFLSLTHADAVQPHLAAFLRG